MVCTVLFLLWSSLNLCAQHFEPNVINYTVDHGVASSECYGLMQDSKGVIWIGTDKGICKYDGLRFSRITTAEGLPDNVIFDLFEDAKGRVWARSFTKGVFYFEHGRMVVPAFNDSLMKMLFLGNLLNNFYVTADDSVFIETDIGKLFVASVSSPSVKALEPSVKTIRFMGNTGFAYGINNDFVKSPLKIFGDANPVSNKVLFREILFRGIKLRNNDVLLSNVDHLLLKRAVSDSLQTITHFKSRIISIFQDRDGSIWVGTINHGLYYYESSLDEPPQHYFTHESISDIIEDTEGNLWLTTLKSGIYCILNKHMRVLASVKEPFSFVKKVGDEYISGSQNGDIYFLDSTGVRVRTDVAKGHHTHNILSDAYCYDKDKQVILFTGVESFLLSTKNYKRAESSWARCFFKGVRAHPDGQGFYLFNQNRIQPMKPGGIMRSDSIKEKTRRNMDIAADVNGNFWIASLVGLIYCNASGNAHPVGNGLLQARLNTLKLVGSKLIIGSAGHGLLMYDTLTQKTRQISQAAGLSSNICQSVFIDGKDIWVGTNKGISVIHTGKDFFDVTGVNKIDKHDGLPGEEINYIYVDGKWVWVASNSGITRFDKNRLWENPYAPTVNFEYVRTNKRLCLDAGERFEFPYDENYLEFSFLGISYKSLRRLKYKYRLTGADDDWHFTYQPRITYPSLAPGVYRFELYAINNDGVSSTAPIVIAFEIRPPFWKTWIFIASMALLCAGAVFLVFYYRIRTIRKREQEKNFYNNRMLEYELRALKAQMNPHFIFNAVASIQNFIMSSDAKSANKYLVKFSKLIRGVLDNSHNSLIPLSRELDILKLYVDIENLRLSNKIHFSIVIGEGVEPERLVIPPMMFQPFVENAIWHGLQPRENECELTITLNLEGGKLICTIDDNGVGRKQAADTGANGRKRTSLGIEITHSRILALEKVYNMNLDIQIIDKTDGAMAPAGTRVIITLPIIT